MPLTVRKGNQLLGLEQGKDFRANHSAVQLTDRIDMAAEDPHGRQIHRGSIAWVQEETSLG
ncbi:hypothetical protein FQZ97_392580 [compost metagenome]